MKKILLMLLVILQLNVYSQTITDMKNNANKLKISINPNPLLKENGKILIKNITIVVPANYFSKEATMTLEPIFMYDGNGMSLNDRTITLNGENSKIKTNIVIQNKENTFTLNLENEKNINYFDVMNNNVQLAVNISIQNTTSYESNETLITAINFIKIVDKNTEDISTVESVEAIKSDEIVDNTDNIQELENKINSTTDQSEKINLYNELGELEYVNQNYSKAIEAFKNKIELKKTNNLLDEITSDYMILANLYFGGDEYFEAIENYNNAKNHLDTVGEKDLAIEIYNNQAIVYQSIGEYNKSIEEFENAYNLAKDSENASQYLYQIANIYTLQAAQDKVIEYYNLIIESEKNKEKTDELSASYNNLGTVYTDQKDFTKAESIFNEALNLSTAENSTLNSTVYNNLGNINFYKGDYDKANEYYLKSIDAKIANNDNSGVALTYYNLANSYLKNGDISKAIENYNKSINFSDTLADKDIITKNYYMLSQIEDKNAQCGTAIDYYKNYIKFKFLSPETEGQISELREKYMEKSVSINRLLTKKDLEIKQLRLLNDKVKSQNNNLTLENKIKEQQNKNLRTIMILVIIAFIVFTILGLMLLRQFTQKRRAFNELILKNEQISTQNEEILSQSEQLKQANEEIITINEDLFQQKEELQVTLENLKNTQKQLIQSEKMAGLGQLIAGIAHELNTPLGAIKSSISTVSDSISKTFDELPILLKKLSNENYLLFLKMINTSLDNETHYSSREERKIKKEIEAQLVSKNIENANEMATHLIDIGIYNNIDEFEILFNHEDSKQIFNTAYTLSNLNKNSNNIKIAVEGAAKIIVALKNYSHTNVDEKIKSNINTGLETVLTIYHNKIKYKTNVEKIFGDIPEINCYPDELNQVWTNIINNAIQAMDNENGKLTITTKHINNQIITSITDTGKGIPTEIQDRIFEPFFTTKPAGEGTGLGLDIVKRIIDKHNGTINFESEVNKGTTFTITLPANL